MIRLKTVHSTCLLILAFTVAACGREEPPSDLYDPPESITPPPRPAVPTTVADIFPATGYRGLVVNRCATCHSAACAAIGQRTTEEWKAVEESHLGAVPGLSMEDRGKIFDFLRRNFNDTIPEPVVPVEMLAGGCSPDMEIPAPAFH